MLPHTSTAPFHPPARPQQAVQTNPTNMPPLACRTAAPRSAAKLVCGMPKCTALPLPALPHRVGAGCQVAGIATDGGRRLLSKPKARGPGSNTRMPGACLTAGLEAQHLRRSS